METIGAAARRLLAKIDERIAEKKAAGCLDGRHEFERDRLSVVRDAVPASTTDAQPAPDTGDSGGHKIATDEPTPRGLEIRMRLPKALGREADRFPRPFASRPSCAQVAANENRRDHARSSAYAVLGRTSFPGFE